jgi:hypothetical protein
MGDWWDGAFAFALGDIKGGSDLRPYAEAAAAGGAFRTRNP